MSGQCISYNNGGLLYELGTQNGAHLFLNENCLISLAYGSKEVFLLPGCLFALYGPLHLHIVPVLSLHS